MRVSSVDLQEKRLAAMIGLANYYCIDCRYEHALRVQIEIEESSRRLFGDENVATLSALSNLASTYACLGRYLEAINLQKKTVDLSTKVLGANSRETLMSLNNLANSYKLNGETERASVLHLELLQRRETLLGEEHFDTVTTMNNLACCYFHIGNLKHAISLQEQVVYVRRRNCGEEHISTLISMENLATIYRESNDSSYSPLLCPSDNDIHTEQDRLQHLKFITGLAQLFDRLGQPQKAKHWHQSSVSMAECIYGPENNHTLATVNNLALSCGYQGLDREAAKNYERVLEGCKKDPESKRVTRLRCMSNFASCLLRLGSTKKAFEMHHEALEECMVYLNLAHPVTVNAISRLRDSYYAIGQYEESLRLEKFMLKINE